MLDDIFLAANHHAVTAFETPHAAAGAYVHVVNLFRREIFCALNIVDIVGVSAVDEDVACFEVR